MSSSYRSPSVGATFRQFLNSFLQTDDVPFREVLTTAQIEQTAAAENVSFGTGARDVYSVPVTLWAFIGQVCRTRNRVAQAPPARGSRVE